MKELSFSTKSWHSILYKSTWGEYSLPNNICVYFWSLIGAILLAPISFIGHSINIIKREFRCVAAWWAFYPAICLIIGCMMSMSKDGKTFNYLHWSFWHILCMGFFMSLLIAFCASVIFGAIWYYVIYIEDRPTKVVSDKVRVPSPLIEGFKAFKGRYCSRIKWVNQGENDERSVATEPQ